MVKKLPVVSRIQGAVLEGRELHEQSFVVIQYSHRKDELYELEIPFLDAMYLLNILRGIEKDMGFESRNKPTK